MEIETLELLKALAHMLGFKNRLGLHIKDVLWLDLILSEQGQQIAAEAQPFLIFCLLALFWLGHTFQRFEYRLLDDLLLGASQVLRGILVQLLSLDP